MPKKILKGRVVCDVMNKTVNVLVSRRVLHPVYKKYVNSNTKFLAHDELNQCKVGDTIFIQENRLVSKRKSWVVVNNNTGSI